MECENLLGAYDESKVTVRDDVYKGKVAWYDVTEIVKNLMDDTPSLME